MADNQQNIINRTFQRRNINVPGRIVLSPAPQNNTSKNMDYNIQHRILTMLSSFLNKSDCSALITHPAQHRSGRNISCVRIFPMSTHISPHSRVPMPTKAVKQPLQSKLDFAHTSKNDILNDTFAMNVSRGLYSYWICRDIKMRNIPQSVLLVVWNVLPSSSW